MHFAYRNRRNGWDKVAGKVPIEVQAMFRVV